MLRWMDGWSKYLSFSCALSIHSVRKADHGPEARATDSRRKERQLWSMAVAGFSEADVVFRFLQYPSVWRSGAQCELDRHSWPLCGRVSVQEMDNRGGGIPIHEGLDKQRIICSRICCTHNRTPFRVYMIPMIIPIFRSSLNSHPGISV